MSQDDAFLQQLRTTFGVEAREHVQAMSEGLLQLERQATEPERERTLEAVFRAAHSLKGAARAVEMASIEALCQALEEIFAAWRSRRNAWSPKAFDLIHRALDAISAQVAAPAGVPSLPPSADLTKLRGSLRRLALMPASAAPLPPAREPVLAQPALAKQPLAQHSLAQQPLAQHSLAQPGADATASESPAPGSSAAALTVRIALLKLETHALHTDEMLVAKLAAGQRAVEIREVGEWFARWYKQWAVIGTDMHRLRQDCREERSLHALALDKLLRVCEWSMDAARAMELRIEGIGDASRRDARTVAKLVENLQDNAKELLALPFSTLSASFPKLVRDLCRDEGKEADLTIIGEQLELDKSILDEMKDPLIHLLRNAVDHAVEPADIRVRLGKPPRAAIRLEVSLVLGNKVQLLLSDDGAGIDVEQVRSEIVKQGRLSAEEAGHLDEAKVMDLVFESRISTRAEVTRLSGRGLGLAIVREKVEKLGGNVSVQSRIGAGSTFRIVLPVMRAAFRGVLVRVGNQLLLAPSTAVECVKRVRPDEVQTVEGRDSVTLGDRRMPLAYLTDVLELPPAAAAANPPDPAGWINLMVLGSGEHEAAFAVDDVLDEQEVLVKPLHKPLVRVRNIAAAAVLGSGAVVPILNVGDLFKSARRSAGRKPKPAQPPQLLPSRKRSILVAEDSITSRMLLKAVLESAGYDVRTSVDGADAFSQLRAGHFDLLVSDVEMPRLNGFDLTAKVRADKRLADLPVILVTALESREDRERGVDVGATAYVAKSGFDQHSLLDTIRQLL